MIYLMAFSLKEKQNPECVKHIFRAAQSLKLNVYLHIFSAYAFPQKP